MTHPAVRRLQNDLSRLRKARHELNKDKKELVKDRRELKHDRRHLAHLRDAFDDDKKELTRDRTAVAHLRDVQKARLGELDAQAATLQAAYDATVDPVTGQGDPALEAQLDALAAQRTQVKDGFDTRIAAKQQEVAADVADVAKDRNRIQGTKREVKQDKREVKHDARELKQDRARVKSVRHRALGHLRPAEYHLGLKATNRVRHALGLESVDHVIRPGRQVTGYVNGVPRRITVQPVGNGEYLRSDAANAYKKLEAAAHAAGINLYPVSGFRTMAEQQHLWALWQAGTGNRAAPPGYSNHQGGVAMDIGGVGGYGTRAFAWLQANAGRFGFRNTVSGEYWHWSYGVNG